MTMRRRANGYLETIQEMRRSHLEEVRDLTDIIEVQTMLIDALEEEADELDAILLDQDCLLDSAKEFIWAIDHDPLAEVRAILSDASPNSTVVSKAKLEAVLANFNPIRR